MCVVGRQLDEVKWYTQPHKWQILIYKTWWFVVHHCKSCLQIITKSKISIGVSIHLWNGKRSTKHWFHFPIMLLVSYHPHIYSMKCCQQYNQLTWKCHNTLLQTKWIILWSSYGSIQRHFRIKIVNVMLIIFIITWHRWFASWYCEENESKSTEKKKHESFIYYSLIECRREHCLLDVRFVVYNIYINICLYIYWFSADCCFIPLIFVTDADFKCWSLFQIRFDYDDESEIAFYYAFKRAGWRQHFTRFVYHSDIWFADMTLLCAVDAFCFAASRHFSFSFFLSFYIKLWTTSVFNGMHLGIQ